MMSVRAEKQGAPVLVIPCSVPTKLCTTHKVAFHVSVSNTKYTYTFRLCDGTRRTQ